MARPRPREEPVIRASWSVRDIAVLRVVWGCTGHGFYVRGVRGVGTLWYGSPWCLYEGDGSDGGYSGVWYCVTDAAL